MIGFILNGDYWRVEEVSEYSEYLIDRTGEYRVATTDPVTRRVYISETLTGDFLDTVLIHELAHCVMFSFGLLDDIHRTVHPEYWLLAEEWICNFIADYGSRIFQLADYIDDYVD